MTNNTAQKTPNNQQRFGKLRKVKLKDAIFTTLMAMALYFLIHSLAGLNISEIWQSIKTAEFGWIFLAFLTAQLLLVPNATSMMAAVSVRIPFKPTLVLQSAIQFIGLAVPSTAGRVATNVAYLRKFGVNATTAVTQGAIDSFTAFIVQVVILIGAIFLGGFSYKTGGDFSLNWVLILFAAIGVVVVSVIVIFTIKSLRRQIVKILRDVYSALYDLFRNPRRVVMLFSSNIASQLVLATSLWLCTQAYGVDVSFAVALTTVVSAVLLGGVAPTPGGLGVQEAILAGGLVAVGVNQNSAFAIAVTYRLFTFFTPPIWGFFSFRWLQKNGKL